MATPPSLTADERQRIGAAVSAAEAHTAGEIVTIITPRSDSYADVALAWSALVGLIALLALAIAPNFYLGLYDRLTGQWVQQWHPQQVLAVAALVVLVKFLGTYLLLLWRPLRLLLVPAPLKSARVRARALTCFRVGAERRTHGRTGILIYLSLDEHRAEIVADEAIASRVEPEVWGDAMAALVGHIGKGQLANGMIAAVGKVGVVLASHLPRAEDDINELPDRLIEV